LETIETTKITKIKFWRMTLGHIEEQKGKNKIANCKNNKPISLPLDMSKGQKLTI
jgi:hypothetical protein